jgi:ribosomal protein S12 methylthiotransferase
LTNYLVFKKLYLTGNNHLIDQSKKCAIVTLGCPKNQVDSEVLAGILNRKGVELVTNPEEADMIFINTCGFIEEAKEESIEAILRAVELKKNGKDRKIFVLGCLSERYREEIKKEIPEVDHYFGVEPFHDVSRHILGPSYQWHSGAYCHRVLSTLPHTAYLKIAEGCDHQCTFCAIPQFKGRYRSRPIADIVQEAESLVYRGVRELILIAQDTTSYGSDLSGKIDLVCLLRELVEMDGLKWIRIMYTHPSHITNDLIQLISEEEKICCYLDMPLQHISDPIRKRMGRGLRGDQVRALIEKLRTNIPGLVLRTAFIVGFPGETEETFSELLDFIQRTKFERLGVFVYSSEEGTEAFLMKPTVSREISEKRYQIIMELQNQISRLNNCSLESRITPVIIDGYDEKQHLFFGRTEGDSLDIDQTVWIHGNPTIGEIVPVLIEGSSAYDLVGTTITDIGEKK